MVAVAGALSETLRQARSPASSRAEAVSDAPREAEPAVVVVTHGLVLGAMLSRHVRLAEGSVVPAHLRNTGVSIVEAHPPHAARLVDCTQHLDDRTHDDAGALSGG